MSHSMHVVESHNLNQLSELLRIIRETENGAIPIRVQGLTGWDTRGLDSTRRDHLQTRNSVNQFSPQGRSVRSETKADGTMIVLTRTEY